MNFEEILIKTLSREASRFEVPANFKRDLEEALADIERTPTIPPSREMIESLKQDIFAFFHPAVQPVF